MPEVRELPPEVRQARRGLVVYFAVLAPLTWAVQFLIISKLVHAPPGSLVLVLMWIPALAGAVARRAEPIISIDFSRIDVPPVGMRVAGAGKALLQAFLFPLLVCFIAYPLAWATGLAEFKPPTEDMAWTLPAWVVPLAGPPVARLFQSLGIHLSVSLVSGSLFAAGEELGWRGYMVPRLVAARVPYAIPLSGVVWSMWHWPLLLAGQDPHKALSLLLFTLLLLPLSALLARWRLESASVLPAILFHGVWNEVMGFVFDGSTPDAGIWLSEGGVLVLGVVALLAIPLLRRPWAVPDAQA